MGRWDPIEEKATTKKLFILVIIKGDILNKQQISLLRKLSALSKANK